MAKKQYGLPYKGSKSKLVDRILSIMPKKQNFYDLFCGGCSIAHGALLSGKYDNIIINDIDKDMIELFINAINGKYHNETRWISRETFSKLKDTDPYIKICWSFGNSGRDYLYGRNIEEYKRCLHYAIVFRDYEPMKKLTGWDFSIIDSIENVFERKRACRKLVFGNLPNVEKIGSQYYCKGDILGEYSNIEQLQRLQSLERLERLERLQSLENLTSFVGDYKQVKIAPNSLIYCDIPYKNTDKYGKIDFDYERFYDWAEKQKELIVISEYSMPEDRFISIAEFEHRSTLCDKANNKVIEKLFVPFNQLYNWQHLFKQLEFDF